jgi:hypothetical protein
LTGDVGRDRGDAGRALLFVYFPQSQRASSPPAPSKQKSIQPGLMEDEGRFPVAGRTSCPQLQPLVFDCFAKPTRRNSDSTGVRLLDILLQRFLAASTEKADSVACCMDACGASERHIRSDTSLKIPNDWLPDISG